MTNTVLLHPNHHRKQKNDCNGGLVWKLWLSTSLLVQPMTPRKVHYPQHKEGRDGAVIKPPQESLDTTASDVILLKIIENY